MARVIVRKRVRSITCLDLARFAQCECVGDFTIGGGGDGGHLKVVCRGHRRGAS